MPRAKILDLEEGVAGRATVTLVRASCAGGYVCTGGQGRVVVSGSVGAGVEGLSAR